jgi:hypothetical protein
MTPTGEEQCKRQENEIHHHAGAIIKSPPLSQQAWPRVTTQKLRGNLSSPLLKSSWVKLRTPETASKRQCGLPTASRKNTDFVGKRTRTFCCLNSRASEKDAKSPDLAPSYEISGSGQMRSTLRMSSRQAEYPLQESNENNLKSPKVHAIQKGSHSRALQSSFFLNIFFFFSGHYIETENYALLAFAIN